MLKLFWIAKGKGRRMLKVADQAVLLVILLLILLLLVVISCSTTDIIQRAETALEKANLSGAKKNCPDKYIVAEEWLQKARDAWDRQDEKAAKRYALEAVMMADVAKGCEKKTGDGGQEGRAQGEPE